MYQSIQAGTIVEGDEDSTISDGTAGGIEAGSITFDFCRRWVDDFVLLEEREIEEAICLLHEHEGMAVEGAAAMPVAAVLKTLGSTAGGNVAAVLSGCRIDPEVLQQLCRDGAGKDAP
jgi:threonine dehydratase